jgi:hypothetical protein
VIKCGVMNDVGRTIIGRRGCRESILGSVVHDKMIVHDRMPRRRNLSRTHFFLRKTDIGRFKQKHALEVRSDTVAGTKRSGTINFSTVSRNL